MNSIYYHTVTGFELDSFGHVNNAVYLNYLEEARWQGFRESNSMYILEKYQLFPVILETNIRYIHELKMFDEIAIKTTWTCNSSVIQNKHVIYLKESKKVIAKAKCKFVLVSKDRIIYDVPEPIIKLFGEDKNVSG